MVYRRPNKDCRKPLDATHFKPIDLEIVKEDLCSAVGVLWLKL